MSTPPVVVAITLADLGPHAYETWSDGRIALNANLDRDEQARCLTAALDRFDWPEGGGWAEARRLRLVGA